MTIRYNQEVATVQCGGFLKLLFKWEGSIYRLLWFELSIFLGIYSILSLTYHFAMSEPSKRTFEIIAQYCNKYSDLIPISFVLGFYVQRVISRYWEQFHSIPWPNRMAMYVSTYIQCHDERGRLMRRTIMRYLCLAFVMTMSSISPPIKKRFPTLTHMTEAGFLLPNEQQVLENLKTANNKYFVPFVWASSVVARARKEGKIKSDLAVQKLITEINDFRGSCGSLFSFDWVSIPLGYTQVVTLAVYIFTLACLLGRYQFEVGSPAEKHFPFFTILQFVFYMGWLKVAESGLSPFGEDDDDFDINLLVDRYLHESYLVVDEMFNKAPDLLKDQHWDLVDFDIPYTEAAVIHKKDIFLGSATGMEVPAEKQAFVSLETSHADLKTSSTKILSSQSLRHVPAKKTYRPKRISTVPEGGASKESLTGSGVVPASKGLELLSSPVSQGEPQPGQETGIGQHPSVSDGQQPRTSDGQQPRTSDGQHPSVSDGQQPRTSDGQQPRTSDGQQPRTSDGQQPRTSDGQQPRTSDGQQPRTSDGQQPRTSDGQQPRTSVDLRASVVIDEQTRRLMAIIQRELRELRSK